MSTLHSTAAHCWSKAYSQTPPNTEATEFWAGLPGEIKNQIYAELFLNDDNCLTVEWDSMKITPKLRTPLSVALMRTNREIYREVQSFLFGQNTLNLNLPPSAAIKFLNNLSREAACNIKSVSVGPRYVGDDSSGYNVALARKLCSMNLDSITVQFPATFGIFAKLVPSQIPGQAARTQLVNRTTDNGYDFKKYSEILTPLTHGLMKGELRRLRLSYPRVWADNTNIDLYHSVRFLRILGCQNLRLPEDLAQKTKEMWQTSIRQLHATRQPNNSLSSEEVEALKAKILTLQTAMDMCRYDFKAARGQQLTGEKGTVVELTSKKLELGAAGTLKRKAEIMEDSDYSDKVRKVRCQLTRMAIAAIPSEGPTGTSLNSLTYGMPGP